MHFTISSAQGNAYYTLSARGVPDEQNETEVRINVAHGVDGADEQGYKFTIWYVDYALHDPIELLTDEQAKELLDGERDVREQYGPEAKGRDDWTYASNHYDAWQRGVELIERFKAMRTLGLHLAIRF